LWDLETLETKQQTKLDEGLSTEAADIKHQEFGDNALTEKVAVPWYCVFLKEQTGFFSLLLWFGAALCFLGYGISDKTDKSNLYLGIVLAFVVFVTGCFSYMQTSKAASLMDDFKNFIPREALVTRDGSQKRIESRLLVPGDVITLNFGDNIPADVVLFKANEMKVNNASLTGESEDLLRKVDAKTANIFESPNVAFFGTMCTAGNGTGIVIRTGDDTVIGRIANLSQSAESAETPLAIEIERFILIVSMVAFTLGISFLIFGFIIGYGPIMNLVFAIGIIVANVPEGLLATVTVSLALTARRMAKKMVLVKNLESVETLGSTSCICSDKTGTLTQNRMTVSQIFYNRKVINASVNFQTYKEGLKRETERAEKAGEEVNLKNVTTPDYELSDNGFMTLVKTIALSTTSYFSYTPGNDVVRARYAKDKKINVDKVPKSAETEEEKADFKRYAEELIEIENNKPYFKQNVEGDASETGLVKFVQPILDQKYGGEYETGMKGCRDAYPIMKYGPENTEAKIPFSSDIKFNLLIRDANKEVESPSYASDNMTVYLKGAPDRVVTRCSALLVDGERMPINDEILEEFAAANDRFAKMGERVLGFSSIDLDAHQFSKSPCYEFDTAGWKLWGEQ